MVSEIIKSPKFKIAGVVILILAGAIWLWPESKSQQTALPPKPELPIVITYREALLHNSIVGQFHNISGKALGVKVVLSNKTFHEQRSGRMYLPPHGVEEIGWLEGWVFVSGETITISNNDYETKTWVVP